MAKSDKNNNSKRASASFLSSLPKPIRTRNRSASMPQNPVSTSATTISKASPTETTSQLPRPKSYSVSSKISNSLPRPRASLASSGSTPAQLTRPLSISPIKPALKPTPTTMFQQTMDIDAPKILKPQPKLIVNLLKKTMGEYPVGKDVVSKLVQLHDQELRLDEEREVSKRRGLNVGLNIFTAKFQDIIKYASATIVFDEKTQDLPILVIACTERLNHVAIDRISALLPSCEETESARFDELCEIFNSMDHFGNGFSLKHESDRNVHALLRLFMENTQLSVIEPPELVGVIDDLCVPTYGGSVRRPDKNTLKTARYLLRLLPTANLSLFLYLFDFAHRVWEVMNDQLAHKAAEIEKVRGVFGRWLFGRDNAERSDNMLHWFLKNRDLLIPGLCSMTFDQAGYRNSMARSASTTFGDDDLWTPSLDRVGNFLNPSPPVISRMLQFQDDNVNPNTLGRLPQECNVPRYGTPPRPPSNRFSADLDVLRYGASAKLATQREVPLAMSVATPNPVKGAIPSLGQSTVPQQKIEEDSDAECRLLDLTPPLLARAHSSNPSMYSSESAHVSDTPACNHQGPKDENITRSFCSDPHCPSIEYIRELEYLLEVVTKERDDARIVVDDIGRLLT